MVKQKACRKCKTIYEGERCPKCQSNSFTEGWKGKVEIINPENSIIAKELRLAEKGVYAIKSD